MDTFYVTPEGITAAQEQIKEAIQLINKVWEKFKEAIHRAVNSLMVFMKTLFKFTGYKRMAKARLIQYCGSISGGKSNNWRKIHGLYLIRNNC